MNVQFLLLLLSQVVKFYKLWQIINQDNDLQVFWSYRGF